MFQAKCTVSSKDLRHTDKHMDVFETEPGGGHDHCRVWREKTVETCDWSGVAPVARVGRFGFILRGMETFGGS